jgi:hypothetical protein
MAIQNHREPCQRSCLCYENVADIVVFFFFGYLHFTVVWNTLLLGKSLHNEQHARSVSLTPTMHLKHLVFLIVDLPAVSFFQFLFLFTFLSSFVSCSFFLFSSFWNKAFRTAHVIRDGILSLFHLNFLFSVFGHLKLFGGENAFTIMPLLRCCICGCIRTRILIHSTWSNLCRHSTQNVCLFLFVPYLNYYAVATWKLQLFWSVI